MSQRRRTQSSQRNSTQQLEQSQFQISTQRDDYSQYEGSVQAVDILATESASYENEDEELTCRADECVQFILLCCLAEKKAIVRRSDLNKTILKDCPRRFKEILEMVRVRLNEVFGNNIAQLIDYILICN